jgi:hypothetical protein
MLGALWSGGVLVYCSGHLDEEPRGHKQPQQETGDPAHNMLIHLMFIYLVTRASLPSGSLSLSTAQLFYFWAYTVFNED